MSEKPRPPRPIITDEDIRRAHELREELAFDVEWSDEETNDRYLHLHSVAAALYDKLIAIKSYRDFYGEEQ